MNKKVAIVTGASSGIGLETVLELLNRGFTVYGGARRTELMETIVKKGASACALDVTDEKSMSSFVQNILDKEGRIDVLVNNAGYGSAGSIEEVPPEEIKRQFDVNVFGLGRMIQLVLPIMRKQRSGIIVNISSIAGKISSPYLGWYHAAKYSVEAISDALRMETLPFGIKTVVIEPGMIQTAWGVIAAQHVRKYSCGGSYKENAENFAKYYEKRYQTEKRVLSDPKVISRTIGKAVCAKNPKTRYAVGKSAKLFLFLKKVLPDKLYQYLAEDTMDQKRVL